MAFLREVVGEVQETVGRDDYLAGLPREPPALRPSFRKALALPRGRLACVVEFKRRSPGYSNSPFPERPVAGFVEAAERGGAVALSCLACRPRFEGSPQDVHAVARTSQLPVLFKDFVVSLRQLDAARRTGASAVLLIARLETEGLLRDVSIPDLNDEAHRRGLETVLELHQPGDLDVALRTPADVFGVNVRDLDTLRLEPSQASQLLENAGNLHPLLGLSGVEGFAQVDWFRSRGVDGFLVGTAVARSPDPEGFISALVHHAGVGEP